MKRDNKYRHEYKSFINNFDYFTLKTRLKHIAKLDKNVDKSGSYKVVSLYFDNVYDKAMSDKVNGLSEREKFRIRYYNNDYGFIRLEKKSKKNQLCLKESVNLTKEECQKIIDGDYAWMRASDNELLLEFYAKIKADFLRPKIIVEYKREAYIYTSGNVRITFDSEIKASSNITAFLSDERPMTPTGNNIILEIKYDEFIPEIISDVVQTDDRRVSGFSKYLTARSIHN